MTYAENKRRVFAATMALALALGVGLLVGVALASNPGVPSSQLTDARAAAKSLAKHLSGVEKTLTASQAAARGSQERATSLARQESHLAARIRAAHHCLRTEHHDADHCVADALR